MSGWPAQSLSQPLMYHPRAKLGLSASTRSISHHPTEILADICQRISGIRQDGRVVSSYYQSPSGESGGIAFVCFRIFASASHVERTVTDRSQGERRPVLRITSNRLLEKVQRLTRLRSDRQVLRVGAQIKVVSGKVARRAGNQASGFSTL